MLWFGGNHLLFKELTSLLCQTQVIVANSSTEDYPHQDDHICLKYVWIFSNQILYRHVVCFVKRQSSIILTKITSEDQGSTIRWYSTGLLMTGLKPFTIKRTSLLCSMLVNAHKPLTTNTLTHKITFTWLTYFRSIYFCVLLTLSKPVTDQRPILLCQLKVILSSCTSVCYTHRSH